MTAFICLTCGAVEKGEIDFALNPRQFCSCARISNLHLRGTPDEVNGRIKEIMDRYYKTGVLNPY